MSFSTEVKDEIRSRGFTLKARKGKIRGNKDQSAEKAFLSECFLRSGFICDPEKMYQMEFTCVDREEADLVIRTIAGFGITAKQQIRKEQHVVYIKEGEAVSDMLRVLGAHNAVMQLENVRILKGVRESVQRQVNCETANLLKTVSAAGKQIEDIRLIESRIGLDGLPENLREIAALRLQMPDATLTELSQMLSTPVGRSGVNHRLRKIAEIAEGLRKE